MELLPIACAHLCLQELAGFEVLGARREPSPLLQLCLRGKEVGDAAGRRGEGLGWEGIERGAQRRGGLRYGDNSLLLPCGSGLFPGSFPQQKLPTLLWGAHGAARQPWLPFTEALWWWISLASRGNGGGGRASWGYLASSPRAWCRGLVWDGADGCCGWEDAAAGRSRRGPALCHSSLATRTERGVGMWPFCRETGKEKTKKKKLFTRFRCACIGMTGAIHQGGTGTAARDGDALRWGCEQLFGKPQPLRCLPVA